MWHIPLLCLFLFAHPNLGQDLADCTAFSSNGLAASQYQYYRFYDFRHVNQAGAFSRSTNGSQSKVVTSNAWKDDWYIRDYPRKSPGGVSIPVNFIPEKVSITNKTDSTINATSYLSLNTERNDAETQSSGEITFREFNISHASLRVNARIYGAPGAVAGIFTYLNDTQESDIEMFTRAPERYVQYSNQPASLGEPTWAPIPGATVNVTMPQNKVYEHWHVHRLDWVEGRSVFFLDDEMTNTTTLQVPIAQPPSRFYINMWGANSTWSGAMEVGNNATLDVLWIEMLFNTTDSVMTPSTQNVCAVENGNLTIAKQSNGVVTSCSFWTMLSLITAVFFLSN